MVENEDNLFQNMSRLLAADIDPVSCHDAIWDRYGEQVSVLVLDSSGFSRVCESHGIIHFLSRLMQLRQICQPVFAGHGCKLLHFEADNAFAVFDAVDDAIASAAKVHRAVHDQRLMLTEQERYRVSIGIGCGPMLYSETLEGYFGEEMNFASKLGEDIACGDETLLTQAAHRQGSSELTAGYEPMNTLASGVELNYFRQHFSALPTARGQD